MNRLSAILIVLSLVLGCSPRKQDSDMLNAAYRGDLDVLKTLVSAGADINHAESNGSTALHWAAINGQVPMIVYLLEKGADIHASDDDGRTPLLKAAAAKKLEAVQILLKKGAVVSKRDSMGRGVLYAAACIGTHQKVTDAQPILDFLLALGLDINERDNKGRTLLDSIELHEYGVTNGAAVYLVAHGAKRSKELSTNAPAAPPPKP